MANKELLKLKIVEMRNTHSEEEKKRKPNTALEICGTKSNVQKCR